MAPSLGDRMVRTAGLFQGLVALPVMLIMGEAVFEHLFYYYYYRRVYDFILSFFNALMAAAIVFIICIQRQHQAVQSRTTRLYLEIAKSSCATAVWLWLLMDSIFGPERYYYYNPPKPRGPRIISACLSSFVLLFLFYPTLVYAIVDKRRQESPDAVEVGAAGSADESTPLLRE